MTHSKIRVYALLLPIVLAALTACSSHCSCPPPAAGTTNIIHEPAN